MSSGNYNRYSRHLLLEGFGKEGQERLTKGKVLIVGAGGLGSPCALYLAAAGVGCIALADGAIVSLSNLQRQVIHYTSDVGREKVDSASDKLKSLNPDIEIRTYDTFLTQKNALSLVKEYDFIVDCTDSYASKYLVNDACILAGKPFCCGGVLRYGGQVMTHIPGSACYRCLFPEPPAEDDVETCSTVGVLGAAVGIMGCIQAAEVIKYLTHTGTLLTDCLLTFDSLGMDFQRIALQHNRACPICGDSPSIHTLKEYSFMPCTEKG